MTKKRLFSALLALILCLSLLPSAALADAPAPQNLWQDGSTIHYGTSSTALTADSDGYYPLPAGSYKMTSNITLDKPLLIKAATVTLDLNGYVLSSAITSIMPMITVDSSFVGGFSDLVKGDLTIIDSNSGSQTHRFTPNASGLWVLNETSGTESVSGGIITGNISSGVCGGVLVENGSSFTLAGGSIVGCATTRNSSTAHVNGAGGVYVTDAVTPHSSPADPTPAPIPTTFSMSGGSIIGCTSSGAKSAGGVLVIDGSTFTMSGGSIRNCKSSGTSSAGGVYNYSATFTMSGGSVRNNSGTGGSNNIVDTTSGNWFTFNDGTDVFTVGAATGKAPAKPADPVKSGKVFLGWTYTEGGIKKTFTGWGADLSVTIPDKTFYAEWETAVTVTVPYTIEVAKSGSVDVPATPDKEFKLEFFGWAEGSSGGGAAVTYAAGTVDRAVTLTNDSIKLSEMTQQTDGSYRGSKTLTITGALWQINNFLNCFVRLKSMTSDDGWTYSTDVYALDGSVDEVTSGGASAASLADAATTTGIQVTTPGYTLHTDTGIYAVSREEIPGGGFIYSPTGTPLDSMSYTNRFAKYRVSVTAGEGGSASASATTASVGTTISLTATPNSSYQFKQWQVTSGSAAISGNQFTMGAGDVAITAMFEPVTAPIVPPFFPILPPAGGQNTPPQDDRNTPDGLNADDHIAYVQGYEDETIRPDAYITRAETAMMLYRLLTAERRAEIETNACAFTDVSALAWYRTAVATMVNGGYLVGYPDGTFGGEQQISRAEFVAILVRFIGAEKLPCSFADVPAAHWAYDYIATAAARGWVTGENGLFRPDDPITRAEAMAILNRVLVRGVDENSTLLTFRVFSDNLPSAWYYYEVIEATNGHDYIGSRPSEDWTAIF